LVALAVLACEAVRRKALDRDERQEALSVFLGRWTARGTSYGGTDQTGGNPKAYGDHWLSTHKGYWHTGKFFLIQDEKADIQGNRFETLSIMGVGEDGSYFARCFENHGFYRNYRVEREGDVWNLAGDLERASIVFEEEGHRQVISWEWKPGGSWIPLCDRIAVRVD
jgi:hypothetical protein